MQIPWVRMRELNQGQQRWCELRRCDFVYIGSIRKKKRNVLRCKFSYEVENNKRLKYYISRHHYLYK
jgi:hypothetical protein